MKILINFIALILILTSCGIEEKQTEEKEILNDDTEEKEEIEDKNEEKQTEEKTIVPTCEVSQDYSTLWIDPVTCKKWQKSGFKGWWEKDTGDYACLAGTRLPTKEEGLLAYQRGIGNNFWTSVSVNESCSIVILDGVAQQVNIHIFRNYFCIEE